mmetsp:Transcript_19472/g.68957  ORF Transcript_19472/g.68957 Transcript_19472/m.68957 type:complete len:378 (-) Transcript_19472:410-1543(-)
MRAVGRLDQRVQLVERRRRGVVLRLSVPRRHLVQRVEPVEGHVRLVKSLLRCLDGTHLARQDRRPGRRHRAARLLHARHVLVRLLLVVVAADALAARRDGGALDRVLVVRERLSCVVERRLGRLERLRHCVAAHVLARVARLVAVAPRAHLRQLGRGALDDLLVARAHGRHTLGEQLLELFFDVVGVVARRQPRLELLSLHQHVCGLHDHAVGLVVGALGLYVELDEPLDVVERALSLLLVRLLADGRVLPPQHLRLRPGLRAQLRHQLATLHATAALGSPRSPPPTVDPRFQDLVGRERGPAAATRREGVLAHGHHRRDDRRSGAQAAASALPARRRRARMRARGDEAAGRVRGRPTAAARAGRRRLVVLQLGRQR